MKNLFVSHKWKRLVSAGLSLAMSVSLLSAVPVSAAPSEKAVPEKTAEKVPVIDKTPVTDKAGSISISQLEDNVTTDHPFPRGTAGSDIFRIPSMITMENGELLAVADIRYSQTVDGNGLDTIAAVSSDGGKTWEYGFPFYFPDSYRDSYRQTTAFIDPGVLEGPDGTIYCIADVFPTEYSIQNIGPRVGTGYVTIDGEQRLALTDNYANVGIKPEDDNDANYLYYVDEFRDGYALILTREDHMPTGYAVDEWYNLYTVDENGVYHDNLKQPQINNESHEVQQNVYYKGSKFHVFQTGYLWMITSKDHGRTWEHPRDIVQQVKHDDDGSLLISPGCGLTTSDGTLVIGAYYYGDKGDGVVERASLLYSSDNGVTWNRTADIPSIRSSENEVVELEDGTIRMFHRGVSGYIAYADFTKNENGGYDVGNSVDIRECPVTSTCNMGAIAYSKKINGKQAIIISWPKGPGVRANGKIFTFLVNENKTMSLYNTVDVPNSEESFSYSNLTELPDGSVALLWEGNGFTTELWYETFDITEFAPGAMLEGANGTKTMFATVEKDETFTKTYTASEDGEDHAVQVAPNQNVAIANVEQNNVSSVKVPLYSYTYDVNPGSDATITDAFKTTSSEPSSVDLRDMEFTFSKNGDKWQAQNQASEKWLTITTSAEDYFADAAGDLTLTPQSDGTIQINGNMGYAIFYKPWMRFNRVTSLTDGCISNFTLWEKSKNASLNNKLPGYQKVKITPENLDTLEGRSCLITVELDVWTILLNPVNGRMNQTKLLMPQVAVPVYSHVEDTSDINTAFATESTQAELLELTDAEFTFTKNEENYHIYNEASQQYLTFANPSSAKDYFSQEANEVTILPQSDGTAQMRCNYVRDGRDATGYAVFYKSNNMNWNRTGGNSDNNGVYNLTFWERDKNAPTDSKIPGYQKVQIGQENIQNGKRYLITAEVEDNIVLLYPVNGAHNQEKLLGDIANAIIGPANTEVGNPDSDNSATKNEVTVTIKGVNEGFTKAVIDGIEYWITVTDSILRKSVSESFDIPYVSSCDTSNVDPAIATAEVVSGAQVGLYDHTVNSNSVNSFSIEANPNCSVTDAEFTFTEDAENEGKWIIKSGEKYMVQAAEGDLFRTEPEPMTVVQTEGAETFQISNASNGRYVMFVNSTMVFNATGGIDTSNSNWKYELTLWKKDDTATDSPIKGYKKVTAGEGIENNGVYLVSYVHQENGQDHVIVIYPKDANNISQASALTKLIRFERVLRITPKTSGIIRITVDGVEYKYQFVDSNCTHPAEQEIIKRYVEADCEKDGYTGDTVCALCETVKTNGTVVSATEHSYSDPIEKQALTETDNGITIISCGNNSLHQKKTIVYASGYKWLKELFQAPPEEISDAEKAKYRESDVEAVKTAYDKGKDVSLKAAAQQTNKEVYSSIGAFMSAKTKMHSYRKDIEHQFSRNIAIAEPIYKEGKKDYHSQEVWNAFETAYTAAVGVTNVGQKSYAELETIITNLKNTSSVLDYENNKESLREYYTAHKDKEKGDYTDKTWKIFEDALKFAKSVLDKAGATLQEIQEAEQVLRDAVAGLKTIQDQQISVPGSIVYTAPVEGQYPKAADVKMSDSDTKHTSAISDWTEETSTLVRNNANYEAEIVNKTGVWGFNDQLKSENVKYDVNGSKTMAISLKLWLNKIQTDNQVEILAKGEKYSLQLKEGKLIWWMYYNGYPTESVALTAGEHTNKWLDVLLLIDGINGKQRIYVNGKSSSGTSQAGLATRTEPFTIGYRQGGDGISFTKDIGYVADIKFYDCGADDVSQGLTRDYQAIVNLLNERTPDAVISADPFEAKTVWSSLEGDQTVAVEGTAKFEAGKKYQATTTFTAHEDFLFPNSQTFRDAVAQTVTTGKDQVRPIVTISEDQKTMTVEVTYSEDVTETCTVNFDANAGNDRVEGMPVNTETEKGALFAKPSEVPVRSGYIFKGWSTSATGPALADSDWPQTIQAATTTFYAVWEKEIYRVNFDANAGNDKVEGMPVNTETEKGALFAKPSEVPVRSGYIFKGWSTSATGPALADSDWPQTIQAATTTFYAVWEKEIIVDNSWNNAKKALQDALSAAKAKYDKGAGAYTSATWTPFKKAYEDAYNQRNATDKNSTAKQLNDLAAALNHASKALKTAPVLKKGDSIVKGNVKYVVTDSQKKTVRAEGVKSKKNKKFAVRILQKVTIKGTKCKVTEVKSKAFYKFTKITKVTIGKYVTKIGKQAFSGCTSMKTLVVSGDVKTFDVKSFSGCKKLNKVRFKGKKVPTFKSNVFKATSSKMKVILAKKMNKKDKARMKTKLRKVGVSKKAIIK